MLIQAHNDWKQKKIKREEKKKLNKQKRKTKHGII